MIEDTFSFSQKLNYLCCLAHGEFHEEAVADVWKEVTRLQQTESQLTDLREKLREADRRNEALLENCQKYQKLIPGCSKPGCGYPDGKPCIGCGRIVEPPSNPIAERAAECVWTWEHDMGYYDAKCGGAYCFDDIFENLPEHSYNFCPKCGLKIRAVTPILSQLQEKEQ